MSRYKIYDNVSPVFTPIGEELTAEQWLSRYPWAKRTKMIVGGGVISAGATSEVVAFIEKYHLPVVHTLMGLGAIPSSHPQSLGFAGMHGEKAANHAIGAADLVIALGSRFGDRQTGNLKKYTQNTKFIHIDIDPAEIDKNIGNSLGLAGNMKVILGLLMKRPGRVYTKVQICEYLNGKYFENDENTIMVHISNLREKIEDNPKNPEYLVTVRGLGYKLGRNR